MDNSIMSNVLSISRLRIDTDGEGVRTLVVLGGCPLKCKYCPNKKLLKEGSPFCYTPYSLLESLKIDDVYFRASYGGITFGGGEPALYSEFIAEFSRICPKEWTVYIETSLNVDRKHIEVLAHVIDHWYIDIKDINPTIYKRYTKASNEKVISNLKYLVERGKADKITIRVPRIPGYNTSSDVEKSTEFVRGLGFDRIDVFDYVKTPDSGTVSADVPMGRPEPVFSRYPLWVRIISWIVCIAVLVGLFLGCYHLLAKKVFAIIVASIITIFCSLLLFILYEAVAVGLLKLFGKYDEEKYGDPWF